ncbi:MAG: AAC(3) family N-acetyltransferase [Flavobacteriales bacterium]|nr:AAC(3) family N-acetyltransferase [Flavobacteriales bacterium]
MNKNLKIAISFILYYSPSFVKEKIKAIKDKKELEEGMARAKRTKVSKEELLVIIDNLDLDTDIMLHTSIMNVGKVTGGAKFIANTIKERVVDMGNHTLLVSALPYRGGFKDYLEKDPVFDVRTAPIAMGEVNSRISTFPGAYRSIHPTHSVVAIGPRSKEYIDEHFLDDTPFGKHSPYYKLLKNKAKILLFGATLNNLTYVHAVEDMVGSIYMHRYYCKKDYEVDCIDANGKIINVKTKCHHPLKCIGRDVSVLYDDMIKEEVMKVFPFGEAQVMQIDVYKFTKFYLNYLKGGRSIYGKFTVTQDINNRINELLESINQ